MRCARSAEPGIFPLDKELGLSPHAFSPFVVEAIVRLGTEVPFERVPELLSLFTQVGIGEETARRISEQAGAILVELEEATVAQYERTQRPETPGPAAQQVSADGAMVHLVGEGWAEVKTLAIGKIETTLGGDVHASEVSYFSRLDTAEEFRRLADGEFCRRGTYGARTVCAVMDGAEWLQKFVDWHTPKAIRILDFPHAAEHLTLAAQAAFGAGTAEASEWLATWRHELRHGDPDRVLAALRELPTTEVTDPLAAAQIRDEVLAYLEKRRAQIAYREFVAAGYPIGSGMVESANKLVVEARLKGSGMHWARGNVNPMLALRAAACSGRWRQVWAPIWPQLCTQPRPGRALPSDQEAAAGADPAGEPVPVKVLQPPAPLPLENKGLMNDGRPTKHHPWRGPLTARAAMSARS